MTLRIESTSAEGRTVLRLIGPTSLGRPELVDIGVLLEQKINAVITAITNHR
jgi:hypothetical protein